MIQTCTFLPRKTQSLIELFNLFEGFLKGELHFSVSASGGRGRVQYPRFYNIPLINPLTMPDIFQQAHESAKWL